MGMQPIFLSVPRALLLDPQTLGGHWALGMWVSCDWTMSRVGQHKLARRQ